MKNLKKKKRYNFQFPEETNDLLELLAKETHLKYCTIVQLGIELFNKERNAGK